MSRILVAGNKELISNKCRILLEAKGYQLLICSNLQESLTLVLDDPPDLLLLDIDFDTDKAVDLIKAVRACLRKANIPVLLVIKEYMYSRLDWNIYPVDDIIVQPFLPEVLATRLQLAESRMIRVFDNNPLSRLPGNTSIIRAIQKTIESDQGFGVCYIDIDNFKPYNDRYGFTQGDDVILMVARIAVNVIEEMAHKNSFVGHVGGDDFVFIVHEDNIKPVCEKILANFDVVRNMFIDPEDLKSGGFDAKDRQGRATHFGLLSLSIAVVTTGDGKFKHYGEVSAVASQIKHHVKELEGSNYLIDRRSACT